PPALPALPTRRSSDLFPQGALLGIIPTGSPFAAVGRLTAQAVEQVQFGVAPLEDTPALTAMLVIGFAAVAILLDQVIATRVPLRSEEHTSELPSRFDL